MAETALTRNGSKNEISRAECYREVCMHETHAKHCRLANGDEDEMFGCIHTPDVCSRLTSGLCCPLIYLHSWTRNDRSDIAGL